MRGQQVSTGGDLVVFRHGKPTLMGEVGGGRGPSNVHLGGRRQVVLSQSTQKAKESILKA